MSLRLTDEAGLQSDLLEITLSDHDPLQPIEMPPTGAELELYLGYDGLLQRMGLYIVDELELYGWPAQMTIRAKAAQFDTSTQGKTDLQTQKSRSWPRGTKLGDMVAKIAHEHHMQAAVSASLAPIVLPHFAQTEESDISFLVRVAKHYDAIAKPAGGKIVLIKAGESHSASGKNLPPILVKARQAARYSMTLARRQSPGTVVAYYHSVRTAKRIEVMVGQGEPVRRLRHWYPTEASARAAAQAELDKRARGEQTLTLTLPGDPTLTAESPLVVSGFRTGVDGNWLITRATHTLYKSDGYQCEVETQKPNSEVTSDGNLS